MVAGKLVFLLGAMRRGVLNFERGEEVDRGRRSRVGVLSYLFSGGSLRFETRTVFCSPNPVTVRQPHAAKLGLSMIRPESFILR